MKNTFQIVYDFENGGVKSLVNGADEHAMNWVEGVATWGTLKNAQILSCTPTETGIQAVYQTDHLSITVTRGLINGRFRERYVFKNRLNCDVFFNRGKVGVYATFNDNYEDASVCMTQKCHTHIWCGKNVSYINAVKMGDCPFGLGLMLIEGSLDSYSNERDLKKQSNDRGDFLLHPSPFHLLPEEETVLEWELFWYETGRFFEEIAKYPKGLLIDADYYTFFSDEKIQFSVNTPSVEIFLEGKPLPTTKKNGRTYLEYSPARTGEHIFTLRLGDVETIAEFFVQIPFRELVKRRIDFIVKNQQFRDERSALHGAYLIYDTQDKCQIFDNLNGDYNASRERLVMGLLVAKYLQYYHDEEIYQSMMDYYAFVTREFYDEESGAVYNTIGMDPTQKRLYNAPWMSMLVMEMYKLTKNATYLDKMFKLLTVYYQIGGERFYPNGLTMQETIEALREAGKTEEAKKLLDTYKVHVGNIVEIGTNYPEHEVRYEQTIVSPGAALVSQMYLLTKDEKLLPEAKKQIDVLERFNGQQPSYKLNDIALRHWDAYWFGKRRMYGDTLPHAASIHTSDAFLLYSLAANDEVFKRRAYRGMRNNLCLFHEDGSASCAYVYPFSVNGVRCEFYDEFANEQDGALYFMIKYFGMLDEK